MIIKIGELKIDETKRFFYLATNRKSLRGHKSVTILSGRDIDSRWVRDICSNMNIDESGENVIDGCNSFYLRLYLIFSCRKRIFYEELIELFDGIERIPRGTNLQEYLWVQLNEFMSVHSYKFVIGSYQSKLFYSRPKIPLIYYSARDFFTFRAILLIIYILGHYMRRNIYDMLNKVCIVVKKNQIEKILHTKFDDLEEYKCKSDSGCIFYKGRKGKKKYFIKCGGFWFSDIDEEINIVGYIKEHSKKRNNYLLPVKVDKNYKIIVYPYVEQKVTLGIFLGGHILSFEEKILFRRFMMETIDDLRSIGVSHRDMHLDNFLIERDVEGNIDGFRLTDFGCACLKNDDNNICGYINKKKNKYAGKNYRYAIDYPDDEGTASFIFTELDIAENINEVYDI